MFNGEPDIHTGLLDYENAVLLPHLGSATQETREAMGFRVLDNLADFFDGKDPQRSGCVMGNMLHSKWHLSNYFELQ